MNEAVNLIINQTTNSLIRGSISQLID